MATEKQKKAAADKKRRAARSKKNREANLDSDIKSGTTTVSSRTGGSKEAQAKAVAKRKKEIAARKKAKSKTAVGRTKKVKKV